MTPDTTPAPMTHEEAANLIRLKTQWLERGDQRVCDDALDTIYALYEAERTRADALAARCAELEAGMTQCLEVLARVESEGIANLDELDALDTARGLLCNGMTEAETDATASVRGLVGREG